MENRNELVTTRVTPQERRRIELAAAHRGTSRSSFVREAADRAAREELERVLADRTGESDGDRP